MARTKEEILAGFEERLSVDPILSPLLNSKSKTALFRSLFVLFSEMAGDFELLFDDTKKEIDELLITKQVNTLLWWQRVALEFQFGDALDVLENGNLGYNTIDTAKQVIQRVAVVETEASEILLKVAQLQEGQVVKMSPEVATAFFAYLYDVSPAGIVSRVISEAGDEVQMVLTVEVDAQIIDLQTGALLRDSKVKPIENAITNYIATFQYDNFGGVFYKNKLLADVLSAEGVINANITSLKEKNVTESVFTEVDKTKGNKFTTYSGYVRLADGWELSDNITYIGSDE